MAFSFFVLRVIVNDLNEKIQGSRIDNVISHKKNGILFELQTSKNEDLALIIDLEPQREIISLRSRYSIPKKNSTTIFSDCIGSRINWLRMPVYDRIFQMSLEENQILEFRVFGRPGNIILFRDETPMVGFKAKDLSNQSLSLVPAEPDFSEKEKMIKDPNELRTSYPFIDKLTSEFLEDQDFFSMEWDIQLSALHRMDEESKGTKKLYMSDSDPPELAAFSLKNFSPLEPSMDFLQFYEKRLWKYYDLEVPRSKAIANAEKEIKSLEKKLSHTRQALEKLGEVDYNSRKADLLMANLHLFQKGISEAMVEDFYSGKKELLKIRSGLTPQEQAEKWYSKSKSRHIEIKQLEGRIEQLNLDISAKNKAVQLLRSSSDLKELGQLLKKNETKKHRDKEKDTKPYRTVDFKGHEIRIGKSGEKNDLLLSRFSKKDDLWFHVRDAPGSHVIIPWAGNTPPERDLIQRAASFAVYFSKRKNEMNCPVIMTQRKFVRKIKGAKPGLVKVEREKVVFADPIAP